MIRCCFRVPAAVISFLAFAIAAEAASSGSDTPRFEKDVLPIFTTYCFTCHGQSSPKLGLDLRTAASTLKGSHNGAVIVKGSPEESLLWQKVSKRLMPPAIYGQKVPEADLEIIKRWIAGGAPFDAESSGAGQSAAAQRERFEKDLLPIFTARCISCHGEKHPMAGLDLRTVSSLLRGSSDGPVIVEGFSERSLLVRKILAKAMPPPAAGKPLSESEVRVIREWIDRGNFAETVAVDSAERPFTALEAPPITREQRGFWSFQK